MGVFPAEAVAQAFRPEVFLMRRQPTRWIHQAIVVESLTPEGVSYSNANYNVLQGAGHNNSLESPEKSTMSGISGGAAVLA